MRVILSAIVAIIGLFLSFGAALADKAIYREVTFAGATGAPVSGTLYRSNISEGFLPAVILQHDCFGLKNFQRNQAQRLAEMGYVALLIDSFSLRNISNTCATSPGPDIGDAIGARRYLESVHGVDHERIGLISWGTSTTIEGSVPFAAMVAIYPFCPASSVPNSVIPLLILTGANDNWAQPQTCLDYINRQAGTDKRASIRIYPGAAHSFDNIELDKPQTLQNVWRPVSQNSGHAKIAYDRLAQEDALKRIEDFLSNHLQLTLAKAYPSKAYSPLPLHADTDDTPVVNFGRGTWVIDPATTGPNLPPVGRSVFDRLFTTASDGKIAYDIPFPYTKLIAFVNKRLQAGRSGGEPIKQVLIPMGRSLQREAAAPDYFSSPRIVAAIDGEPNLSVPGKPVLLKDRLFLGYVERTNVLEVISYNEAASRFEFQVVKNYARGKTPEVFYANRRLCTSCHQNKSPLFSREGWTESNRAEGEIGRRLRQYMNSFHGVTVRRSAAIPAQIDLSTDRANLFSVLQKLWREGCGSGSGRRSILCRAAAYRAMIQFRLTNTQDFDREDPNYKSNYEAVITRNWRQTWPGGLFIPNSEIPNRDPLAPYNEITGSLDPLTKRGPMEIWSGYRRSDPERLITSLADQFTVRDIEKLDKFLLSNASGAQGKTVDTMCGVSFNPQRGLAHPLKLECTSENTPIILNIELSLPGRQKSSGKMNTLEIAGLSAGDRIELAVTDRNPALFELSRLGMTARLPDGRRVASIVLTPLSKVGEPVKRFSKNTRSATAEIRIVKDFDVVENALTRLVKDERGIFSDEPFHGPKSMSKLFDVLGIPSTKWCCDADAKAPPLRVDTIKPMETASSRIHARSLKLMTGSCGACHRTNNAHPPNFLTGSAPKALAGIRACAPRILRRLALWDTPESQREQTAMPPLSVLHARGLTAEIWRQSSEIRQIREFVENLAGESGDQYPGILSCSSPL